MKLLLDTATWLWWNARPDALSPRIRQLLTGSGRWEELLLSAASLWELCRWLREGKIGLSLEPERWIEQALDLPGLRVVDLSPRILSRAVALPEPAPPDDTDRVLVATAREEDATILTPDPAILTFPHVKSLW